MNRCVWLLVVILAAVAMGCPREQQTGSAASSGESPGESPTEPRPSVTLRLVVVNEPDLAEAISRLRGEWADRSGGELKVSSEPWQELIAGKTIEADLILFPSRYLGELCVRDWLRPVRNNVLESDALSPSEIFPLVRQRLIAFDNRIMAVPLGIDLAVLCYRADYFDEAHRRPPDTWSQYSKLSSFLDETPGDESRATLPATWEPVYTWGFVLLLSRAATYADSQDRFSVLFDTRTMSPRIGEEPFVRALSELQSLSKSMLVRCHDPRDETDGKLREPYAASWKVATGYALFMAIGLPPAGHRSIVLPHGKLAPADGSEQIGWTQLPGSDEIYDLASGEWESQVVANRVPLLGIGDRLAAVTNVSRNAASAFNLLEWLAQSATSSQFARADDGTMPIRRSLASSPDWYDPILRASERDDLGKILDIALSGERYLLVPRIPGIDDYLAALDQAVQDAVFDGMDPQAALAKAAQRWEEITDAHGRDAQRQAYLKHLGIREP